MAYKIAVATSDGVTIDRTFGSAEHFAIYEVHDKNFTLAEKKVPQKVGTEVEVWRTK